MFNKIKSFARIRIVFDVRFNTVTRKPKSLPEGPIKPLWRNIYKQLSLFHDEHTKIEKNLHDNPDCLDSRAKEAMRMRLNEIEPIVSLHQKYRNIFNGIEELKEMAKSDTDKDSKDFIKEEEENYKNLLVELEEKAIDFLIPKDKFDDCMSINFEIRPGVGGAESSLFAEDLLTMYQNFCAMQGWRYKIVQYAKDMSIGKGCKMGILKISGDGVYKKLKCESGVHKSASFCFPHINCDIFRVIRVPETERYGRLHSSAVSVDFKLDEKDLKFEFMRASGAGGQHVNKTDSACRVTHIPTGIAVHNQEDRSQDKNRKNAVEILTNKLFMMEVEKASNFLSSKRKEQIATADRSDKIRTYNFPQSRITDHRTNLTLFGIERMLNGEFLEQFIDEYSKMVQNEKLKSFLEDMSQDSSPEPKK